jgi:hypothetical protein
LYIIENKDSGSKDMAVNYYTFDEISKDVEVYPLDGDETDEEIKAVGFAKCDAPKGYTETFVVEETAWATLNA